MPWPQNSRTTREAVLLGVGLDRGADVAEAAAGPHLADAEPHALVGHLDQAPRLDARLADVEHAAGVAVVAVLDDGDVDVQDVARLEHPLARDAVADLVVDRGADRLSERAVARRGVVERRRARCAARRPCSRGTGRSASPVVTPGLTWGVMKSSTSEASRPAMRMRSDVRCTLEAMPFRTTAIVPDYARISGWLQLERRGQAPYNCRLRYENLAQIARTVD